MSGAFAAFAATATLSSSQVILRSPERTYPFALSPRPGAYHAAAASFGLDALLLPALSSRHQRGAADTSNQRMPPNLVLSTSLHPCSRRSIDFPESPPVRSRSPSVHADEPASAGPLEFVRRVIRSTTPLRSSPLTSPSWSLFAFSGLAAMTNAGLNHRVHLRRRAVTQRRLPWTRDAFGRSRFERRFLSEEAAPFRGRLVSNHGHLGGLRPFGDRWSLFAFVGSRSILVRARCSHEASPCLRPADCLVASRA